MGPTGEDLTGKDGRPKQTVRKPTTPQECADMYAAALEEVLGDAVRVFRHCKVEMPPEVSRTYEERASDSRILSAVFSRLCAAQEGDPPVKVLEVGAGATLSIKDRNGRNPDESSPWLSRGLQRAFGSLINVTVSDVQSEYFQYMVVLTCGENYVLHCSVTPPVIEQGDFFDPYVDTFPRFQNDLVTELQTSADPLALLRKVATPVSHSPCPNLATLQQEYDSRRLAGTGDYQIRILPVQAPAIEQSIYQVRSVPGVDMQRLGERFSADEFDVVFGRHLYPRISNLECINQRIKEGLDRIMRPEGEGILIFDDFEDKELTHRKSLTLPERERFKD